MHGGRNWSRRRTHFRGRANEGAPPGRRGDLSHPGGGKSDCPEMTFSHWRGGFGVGDSWGVWGSNICGKGAVLGGEKWWDVSILVHHGGGSVGVFSRDWYWEVDCIQFS